MYKNGNKNKNIASLQKGGETRGRRPHLTGGPTNRGTGGWDLWYEEVRA